MSIDPRILEIQNSEKKTLESKKRVMNNEYKSATWKSFFLLHGYVQSGILG